MSDKQYDIALPPGLEFVGGYRIVAQALNPTTGAFMAGVQITGMNLQVDATNLSGLEYGPWQLVTGPGG